MINKTEELVLVGFGRLQNLKHLVFMFFFMVYIATLLGNFLIILLVLKSHQLHIPMYYFLLHLSVCDIVFTTNIAPTMLHNLLLDLGKTSMKHCISQFYMYGTSTITECYILTLMSYDRYLAICKPLHYTSTMDINFCLRLVGGSWLSGLLITLCTSIMVFNRDFCGPNIIDHFMCELAPLLKLSCSDTTSVEVVVFVLSIPIIVIPFVFIVVTYINIFITVLKIPSTSGRQKTFSTCSSHLTSVGTYYGTLTILYVVPKRGPLLNVKKALHLLYTVVTPLFNPVIYSLRNQDIRKAIQMLLFKKR
ncbi:olfactory receptor 11L1-like [Eleutherodactylus coqui]|uniref:olfactory receptor 11L1-like n=1 Tax=Eleutherodactylus coqui TaxID=57060 RepID=UPI0034627357